MPNDIDAVSDAQIVLLVDDEPQIRTLLEHLLLKEERYQVLTAGSGEEALDVSRQCPDKIDLLITDIDMGKMNGIQLYRHIREERPDTAALFISGKADGFRDSLPQCPLLEKPFPLGKFVQTVQEVLARFKRER
jgi:two-component system cell cycle sensor histidine kinase/response regulator CckA